MLRELAWRARERVGRLRWRLGLMPVPSHALAFSMAYNQFGAYCIPNTAKNRPAPKRLFAGLVWEESTIEYIIANCADGDVISAGAFFGDFLPAISRGIAPGATLWAFEPNPESYRCAAITGLINDLQNLKLFNAALGERCGKDELIISDFEGRALTGVSQLKGIVDKDGVRGEQAVPVQVLAIDEVVPSSSRVSVVQLDVEGGEDAALTGAMATIERSRPVLIVETLPRESTWLCKELFKLGYRIDCKLGSENTALRVM
jgi:FkbM family methyltransferase